MGAGEVGSESWTQAIDGSAAYNPCRMHAPAAGMELQELDLQDVRQSVSKSPPRCTEQRNGEISVRTKRANQDQAVWESMGKRSWLVRRYLAVSGPSFLAEYLVRRLEVAVVGERQMRGRSSSQWLGP